MSTLVDKLIARLKKNKLIAIIVVVGTVVIAIAKFTDAVTKIADFVTKLQGRTPPKYEAWIETNPNPLVHGAAASLQFYFNNSSANRVTLKRMTSIVSCEGTSQDGEVDSTCQGWKSSIVPPQTPKHNFYGADHQSYHYSCGGEADHVVTMDYEFKLFFDDGSGTEKMLLFKKTLRIVPQ